jgi:TolB-like protein
VLRIQALEATEGQKDQEQLAEYVTSALIGGMKNERLPVKGLALVLDFSKGNEAQILQKAARKKGICYVLRGHIDAVDAEARNELLRYLYRVTVSITVDLVDTESGKSLKTFQGKGLCSIQVDKKSVAGLTPFRGERVGESPFAFRAASECVTKKLLPQIVKAYPNDARTPVKAGAGSAALHITVEAYP